MTQTTASIGRHIRSWWRRNFGMPPSWSFSFAHRSAALNRTSWEDEFHKEQAMRKRIVQAWREGL